MLNNEIDVLTEQSAQTEPSFIEPFYGALFYGASFTEPSFTEPSFRYGALFS
jgi:hypothetical protein